MTRALQGDYKFLMAVIALIRLSGLADLGSEALLPETDSRTDEAILADFLERQGFSRKHSVTAEPKSAEVNSGRWTMTLSEELRLSSAPRRVVDAAIRTDLYSFSQAIFSRGFAWRGISGKLAYRGHRLCS
jgi:hypothetical protein